MHPEPQAAPNATQAPRIVGRRQCQIWPPHYASLAFFSGSVRTGLPVAA